MQRRDVGVACRLLQRSDGDGRGQHVLSFNMSLLDHRIAGLSQFVTMALSATNLPGQPPWARTGSSSAPARAADMFGLRGRRERPNMDDHALWCSTRS